MSEAYDRELRKAIDMLVLTGNISELRSDDPFILNLYSGQEEVAIDALRKYADGKGKYFDKHRKCLMPKCEFVLLEDGHAVVDLIHLVPNKAAELQRENYLKDKERREQRNGGFY